MKALNGKAEEIILTGGEIFRMQYAVHPQVLLSGAIIKMEDGNMLKI
jgi:hypothetical protein